MVTDHGTHAYWMLDPELRRHIQTCPCTCNHMGYGNYLDYQIPPCPRDLRPIRETSFNLLPQYYTGIPDHHYYPYEYNYHDSSSLETCSCSTLSDTQKPSFRGPWCICLVITVIIGTLAAGLGLPLALNPVLPPETHEERLDVVYKLLKEAPLIDGHNDLPWNIRKFVHNKLVNLNFSSEPWNNSAWSQTDIRRLKKGFMGAQFWSAYVPCKAQHLDAVQITLEQIDIIKRLVDYNVEHLAFVQTSTEILDTHKQGRIASLIGVEGGHSLGNSLAVLRTFYNLGARYLTITHSCDTQWARGSNSKHSDGLTDFGKSVIKEMNRLGMIIDLSHTSMNTAKDAINISQAPVIFSHSGAYSLCNSSRNVPDDVLKLIAHNGGVVMVHFYNYHITCNETAGIKDVISHINHIRAVAGIDHVGIGAGYDGINMTPSGLEDVSRYPHLLAELLADPAWSQKDITSLAGLNLLRVFQKVEEIRDNWKLAAVLPVEDLAPPYPAQCSSLYS